MGFLAERGVAGGDRGRIETWLAEPPVGAVAEIDRLPEDVARRCRPYAGVIQTDEVVRAYKGLEAVERAFGTFKGPELEIRPIHHRLEDRVRAHVLLCTLAYYLTWHLRQA